MLLLDGDFRVVVLGHLKLGFGLGAFLLFVELVVPKVGVILGRQLST